MDEQKLVMYLIVTIGGMVMVAEGDDTGSTHRFPDQEVDVVDQSRSSFVPIQLSDLPSSISLTVRGRLVAMLEPGYRPWEREEYYVAVYAAADQEESDLVDVRYVVDEYEVRLLLDQFLVVMQIQLAKSDQRTLAEGGEVPSEQISLLCERMMRLKSDDGSLRSYEIVLPWPKKLKNGMSFSSNPDQRRMAMGRWTQRVDVKVEDGVVKLYAYWKSDRLMHFPLEWRSQCFDADFRSAIQRGTLSGE